MTTPTASRDHHLTFWLIALATLALGLTVFREILLPFVAGIVGAYFLNPIADALQNRGLGRTSAVLLIIGGVGIAVIGALIMVAPLAVEQVKHLAATLPADLDRLRTSLEQSARARFGGQLPALQAAIEKALADLQSGWTGSVGQLLPALLNRSLALINILSLLFITPLVTFYLLVDWHRMLDTVARWLPRDHATTITRLAREIDTSVAAFIRGQGVICLLLGTLYAAGLSAIGLRYGLVVGLATGLLAFIPVAGWVLGLLLALGLALAQFGFDPVPLLSVAGVMVAGMALDTALLSPRLVGEKVGLHPVWLIFALFAFSYLFGFVGTLVAVPLAAAAVVLVRHGMGFYMQSDVYLGQAKTGGTPAP